MNTMKQAPAMTILKLKTATSLHLLQTGQVASYSRIASRSVRYTPQRGDFQL